MSSPRQTTTDIVQALTLTDGAKQRPGKWDAKVKRLARDTEIINLKLGGVRSQQISDLLGVPVVTINSVIHKWLANKTMLCQLSIEEYRELQLQQYAELLQPQFALAREGNRDALDACLSIMDRQAKLLGLNAPTKIAPTDPGGNNPYAALSDSDLVELFAEVQAKMADAPDGGAPGESSNG